MILCIGIIMFLYCLLVTFPITAALVGQIIHGVPFVRIISKTFYFSLSYWPRVLLFSFAWLSLLTSSIGILRKKNWGRVIGVYITAILTIWSFGFWLYMSFSGIINPPVFSGSPAPEFAVFIGFILLIIPIGLPSLMFLILLTRKKIKARFKNTQ